jgi:hypothetical protein
MNRSSDALQAALFSYFMNPAINNNAYENFKNNQSIELKKGHVIQSVQTAAKQNLNQLQPSTQPLNKHLIVKALLQGLQEGSLIYIESINNQQFHVYGTKKAKDSIAEAKTSDNPALQKAVFTELAEDDLEAIGEQLDKTLSKETEKSENDKKERSQDSTLTPPPAQIYISTKSTLFKTSPQSFALEASKKETELKTTIARNMQEDKKKEEERLADDKKKTILYREIEKQEQRLEITKQSVKKKTT